MPHPKSENLRALTGLRVLGAWLVYVHHFPGWVMRFGWGPYCVATECHVGVTLFFVLSGFVMAWTYRDSRVLLSRAGYLTYLRNRFARIFPLYWIVLALVLVLTPASTPQYWVTNLFLLGGLLGPPTVGIVQSWTLGVEMTFYLLMPLILFQLNRASWPRIVGFLYVAGAVLVFPVAWLTSNSIAHTLALFATYTFFGRCFEFILGMLLAKALLKKGIVTRSGIPWFTLTALIGSVACIYLMSELRWISTRDWRGTLINNWVLAACFGLLIYGAISEPRFFFNRILGSRVFVLLGKASYAFYLIHLGPIKTLLELHIKGFPGNSVALFLALNVVACLFYLGIEEPLRFWVRRRKSAYQEVWTPS
jgi:peptidoglycan/LPS O-acetylase OafA/YrhL